MSTPSHILIASSLCLALGITAAGFFIGHSLKEMKKADRFVTVKGLVERDINADLAVWPLRFKVTGDDLAAAQSALLTQQEKIATFLTSQGLSPQEFETKNFRVIDRHAREYDDGNRASSRYILEATTFVRTTAVEKVRTASQNVGLLLKEAVALTEDNPCETGPRFFFTKLNEVKPEMLVESTRNARQSAEQFAADSGSAVGSIRQASQGYFSITPRDSFAEQSSNGGCQQDSGVEKRVRVVTTIDYFLVE